MGYLAEVGNKRENEESAPHSKLQEARWLEKGGLAQGALWEEFKAVWDKFSLFSIQSPPFHPQA